MIQKCLSLRETKSLSILLKEVYDSLKFCSTTDKKILDYLISLKIRLKQPAQTICNELTLSNPCSHPSQQCQARKLQSASATIHQTFRTKADKCSDSRTHSQPDFSSSSSRADNRSHPCSTTRSPSSSCKSKESKVFTFAPRSIYKYPQDDPIKTMTCRTSTFNILFR